MTKDDTITVRLEKGRAAKLRVASDKGKNPYAPSVTQIVERGIDLALNELERKAGRKARK